jgi:hypothetical protein
VNRKGCLCPYQKGTHGHMNTKLNISYCYTDHHLLRANIRIHLKCRKKIVETSRSKLDYEKIEQRKCGSGISGGATKTSK